MFLYISDQYVIRYFSKPFSNRNYGSVYFLQFRFVRTSYVSTERGEESHVQDEMLMLSHQLKNHCMLDTDLKVYWNQNMSQQN